MRLTAFLACLKRRISPKNTYLFLYSRLGVLPATGLLTMVPSLDFALAVQTTLLRCLLLNNSDMIFTWHRMC